MDKSDRFDPPPPPARDIKGRPSQPDDPGPEKYIEWDRVANGGTINPAKDYRRQSRRLVLKAITWGALLSSLVGIAYAYFQ